MLIELHPGNETMPVRMAHLICVACLSTSLFHSTTPVQQQGARSQAHRSRRKPGRYLFPVKLQTFTHYAYRARTKNKMWSQEALQFTWTNPGVVYMCLDSSRR